ncbi:MAG: efflux RND transporter periplasmic adaptor subunit [Vicinamibacterales bacterium]
MTNLTSRPIRFLAPLLALGTAAACSHAPAEGGRAAQGEPLRVQVVTAVEADVTDTSEAGGVVQARTTATVAARLMAPVAAVRVAPGDRVRAGQVLVELDGRDLSAAARSAAAGAAQARDAATAAAADQRAAEAGLVLARASHGRIAALHAKKSATAQELDEATAALAAAEARSAAAAAQAQAATAAIDRAAAASDAASATAGFLQVTAPFDGLVTEKLVEPGNMATPGLPLVRVEDVRGFRLEARMDESRAGRLSPGTTVDVEVDGPDGAPVAVQGTVSEVSRAVDAGTRSFLVKIDLPSAGLRSGGFGRVKVPGPARRALTVPETALVHQGQVTSVFVVDGEVARLRLVRVHGTEVQAGLQAGDAVIVSPPPGLADGRRITVGGGR